MDRKPLAKNNDTKKRRLARADAIQEVEEEKEEVQPWNKHDTGITNQKPKSAPTVSSRIASARKRVQEKQEARLQHVNNARMADDYNDDNDDVDILKILEKQSRQEAASMDNDKGASSPLKVAQPHGTPKHTVSSTSAVTVAPPPPDNIRRQTAPATCTSSRTSKLPRNPQEAAVTPGAYRTAPGQKLKRNRATRYSVLTREHQTDSSRTDHENHASPSERLQTTEELTELDAGAEDSFVTERQAQEERKHVLQQTGVISTKSLLSPDDNNDESTIKIHNNKDNKMDTSQQEETQQVDMTARQPDREEAEQRKSHDSNGNGNGMGRHTREEAEQRKRVLQNINVISTTGPPPSDFNAKGQYNNNLDRGSSVITSTTNHSVGTSTNDPDLLEQSPFLPSYSAPVMEDISSRSSSRRVTGGNYDAEDNPEWETPPPAPQQESVNNNGDDQAEMRGEGLLIEATLVTQGESRRHQYDSTVLLQDNTAFIEAKALDSNDIMWAFLTSRKGILIVCLAVILITGVILGMALGMKNRSVSAAPSFEPTSSPTLAPTVTFTIDMLPEFSKRAIKADPESPQALAWEWLENDNYLNDYPLSRQIQRFALATFYFATGGPRWRVSDNWLNFSSSECLWYSTEITGSSSCPDPTDRRAVLVTLSVRSNGLSGTLPKELSLLSGLKFLNLGVSSLDGTIPTELGLLTSLLTLGLNDADLGGSIPKSFGGLSQLEVLNIAKNEFRGSLQPKLFQNMTNLKILQLSQNFFLGDLPTSLQYLTSLTDIDLSSCRFSGSIPSEFGLATSLVSIKANNNLLRGNLPNITNLTNLLELDLTSNLLSGPVANLPPSLTKLHLGFNELTAANFAHMASLNRLSSLSLESCRLTGTIPTSVGILTSLKYCNLRQNRLSGRIPTELALVTFLNTLELDQNMLTGSIPSEIGTLTALEALFLSSNQLSSSLPTELGQASNLVDLDLHSNAISGVIPSELGHLNLEFLDLSFNLLSSSLPSELGLCHPMIFFSAAGCDLVNGSLPSELGHLSFLEALALSKTGISGSIPPAYGGMSSLMLLQLDNCKLNSTLPSELGLLTLMRQLELSHNTFSGRLPFSDLKRLQSLRMDRNNFIGTTVPTELGLFGDLKELSCSACGLIGTLPSELFGLAEISNIDLSQNNLEGPILPPTERSAPLVLTSLNFHQNNFTGTIPTIIGLTPFLEHLAVDFNALQGTLPSQLGLLTGLTALHLSANNFSGSLPSELALLTNLVILELDQNRNISGPIPLRLFGLTNLNELDMQRTQLTGRVPDDFCAKFPGLAEVNCSLINCSCCDCK